MTAKALPPVVDAATWQRHLDELRVREKTATRELDAGSRVTKAPKDLESHFRWHGDAFTDGQIIDTITPRDQRAKAGKRQWPQDQARARVGPRAASRFMARGVGVLH